MMTRIITACVFIAAGLLVPSDTCSECTVFSARGGGAEAAADRDTIRFTFDGPCGGDGVPAPWKSRCIHGTQQINILPNDRNPREKVLWVRSDRSHFLLWNPMQQYDAKTYPILKWSWKAITLPTHADVRADSLVPVFGDKRNDAAVQVLVGFEGNKVLSYIWDSTAPVGTEVEEFSPVATIRTRVIDSGTLHLNQWQDHRVNIWQDYQHRYGAPPGRVLGISVQSNSNNTQSLGEGLVGPITASMR